MTKPIPEWAREAAQALKEENWLCDFADRTQSALIAIAATIARHAPQPAPDSLHLRGDIADAVGLHFDHPDVIKAVERVQHRFVTAVQPSASIRERAEKAVLDFCNEIDHPTDDPALMEAFADIIASHFADLDLVGADRRWLIISPHTLVVHGAFPTREQAERYVQNSDKNWLLVLAPVLPDPEAVRELREAAVQANTYLSCLQRNHSVPRKTLDGVKDRLQAAIKRVEELL